MARTRIIYSHITGKKMAEYKDDALVWSSEEYGAANGPAYYVQNDIQPYQSMVTGEMITSRSHHREHLRKHNLIEIGNETKYLKPKPLTPPPGLKECVIRVVNEKWRKP